MLLSNSDTSHPPSIAELLSGPSALGVSEGLPRKNPSPYLEHLMLRLSTSVIEPLVAVMDESRFGGSVSKHLILLPKQGSRSLHDCILVTPENWEKSGLPNFWTYTASIDQRPIGWNGASNLVLGILWCQSVRPLAWYAASKYVDRRFKYPLSRHQRRNRIEFWTNRGWAGTERLVPVQLSSLKTPYQLLKSHVTSKWRAYMGAT